MQGQFPKINVIAVACCALAMYVLVVRLKLGIPGYIIGFATRFLVEFVWEIIVLCKDFPVQAVGLPSVAELKTNLLSMTRFSFVFIVGYSSELFMFEVVPIILFQSRHPSRNIALWMSIYQVTATCNKNAKIRNWAID